MVASAEDGPEGGPERAGRGGDDGRLWEVFRGLVEARGRTAAADALGVNYRTVVANLEAGRLSRRMRTAVQRFENEESEPEPAGSPETAGAGETTGSAELGETTRTAEQRVDALVAEVGQLEETVQSQAGQLEEMGRRVAELEEAASQGAESERNAGPATDETAPRVWQPPKRAHELPDAGVVTLERQPDEEHAFGPAAGLVAEWRELRTGGTERGSGVGQAKAEERRWELEVLLIEDYQLTLPPEREPLQGSRRGDHLSWRRETLAHARRQRVTAERWETLRTVLTLGLWRR